MRIFISWSGDRSLCLAKALETFVRRVIQTSKPWVSAGGIEKGSRWSNELFANLRDADAGIICLTSENLTAPWILFEAGALALKPHERVWTVLLDITNPDVDRPLGEFNHTSC